MRSITGRRGVLLLMLTLIVPATRAKSQEADTVSKILAARAAGLWHPGPTPVVFSFSGGISLGAYQAGVNWVMVQAIKGTHYQGVDDSFVRLFPPKDSLPDLSVIGM